MERMLPAETAQLMVRGGAGATALRTGTYLALALAVSGGAWLRFNPQLAALLPALAAQDGVPAGQHAAPAGLVDLAILPGGEAEAALGGMGLGGGDAALLLQALRRGQVRMVRMPLVDASVAGQGGQSAHAVTLSTAGYTTTVQLTRTPLAVPLPVGPLGTVSFSTPGSDPVGIGMLGLTGPVRLPDLPPGQSLSVGVVVQ